MITHPSGQRFRALVQQRVRGRAQKQKLPGAISRAAAAVDLSPQRPEETRHQLHLVDHHKLAHLVIEIEIWLLENLPIRAAFHVEIDSVARLCDILRQCGLAHLARPKKHNPGLRIQGLGEPLKVISGDHTLYLCHPMEDLQG